MGMAKFWPRCSKNPTGFWRKLGYKYVTTPQRDHTSKSVWCCDNVGGLGKQDWRLVTYFPSLVNLSCLFTLYLGSCRARTILPLKDVSFGRRVDTALHSGIKSLKTPQKRALVGIFKSNSTMTSGFPRMPSTNVPMGRSHKQSSVTLYFSVKTLRCGLWSKFFDHLFNFVVRSLSSL